MIYTSDHGYFLGDHGWYDKRFMYEQALRIPLIIRFPGSGSAGHVSDELTMNIDYAVTILDAAGIEPPATCQGTSLLPLVRGQHPDDWRYAVYYHYYEDSWELQGKGDDAMAEPYAYFIPHRIGPHRGVCTDRYKLIEYYGEGDYWELFDLELDPKELVNRYEDSGYEAVLVDMKARLTSIRSRYGDLH